MNRHGSHNIRNGIAWAQTGPRHSHMNTPKIRIVQKKKFPGRQNSNSNLLINSKKTSENRSNLFPGEWYSSNEEALVRCRRRSAKPAGLRTHLPGLQTATSARPVVLCDSEHRCCSSSGSCQPSPVTRVPASSFALVSLRAVLHLPLCSASVPSAACSASAIRSGTAGPCMPTVAF